MGWGSIKCKLTISCFYEATLSHLSRTYMALARPAFSFSRVSTLLEWGYVARRFWQTQIEVPLKHISYMLHIYLFHLCSVFHICSIYNCKLYLKYIWSIYVLHIWSLYISYIIHICAIYIPYINVTLHGGSYWYREVSRIDSLTSPYAEARQRKPNCKVTFRSQCRWSLCDDWSSQAGRAHEADKATFKS